MIGKWFAVSTILIFSLYNNLLINALPSSGCFSWLSTCFGRDKRLNPNSDRQSVQARDQPPPSQSAVWSPVESPSPQPEPLRQLPVIQLGLIEHSASAGSSNPLLADYSGSSSDQIDDHSVPEQVLEAQLEIIHMSEREIRELSRKDALLFINRLGIEMDILNELELHYIVSLLAETRLELRKQLLGSDIDYDDKVSKAEQEQKMMAFLSSLAEEKEHALNQNAKECHVCFAEVDGRSSRQECECSFTCDDCLNKLRNAKCNICGHPFLRN